MNASRSRVAAPSETGEDFSLVRVRMIRESLACFALGCIGLVPGLGLPFALRAWMHSNRVMRAERTTWNPARGYRVTGMLLASVGVVLTVAAVGLVLLAYA